MGKHKGWSHLSKSDGNVKISKIKKLQKVTFAFLHTCTRYLPVLGGPNRKSATFHTFRTLALPNRPSRTFAYVYDVFARSGRSKTTFGAFGAYLVKSRSPGRRTLNRGGPTLPLSSRTLLSLVDRTAPQPSPDGCGAEIPRMA